MHLGGTEGDAGERWSGETKMKKVTSMRVNMQRQNKTDMKMQEEAEEILGGRVWGVGGATLGYGRVVHLGGTEGTAGLCGLTRCH